MDQHLKQRIVGAIVLVSIAVIFVPMLFEEQSERGDLSISETNIPEFPTERFEEKVLPIPLKEEIEQQVALPVVPAPIEEPVVEKAQAAISPEASRKSEVELAPAYVIQVGSFGKESNAKQLAGKLSKAGFPSFVKLKKENKKTMYRVLVGPELDQKRAEQSKIKIEKLLKLKVIVLKQQK